MTLPSLAVSVVVPLFNGQRFIGQALASVFSQTMPAHEVIVVDDGSTDDGLAVVMHFAQTHPVKIVRQQNAGQSAARNAGIAQSTGALVALLDQDDVWYPHHLEDLAKPFAAVQPASLGWVYSNLDEIDESGRLVARQVLDQTRCAHPKVDLFGCLRHDMFILPSASLLLRQAFDAVGGFDERLSGYEDDDLFVRLFSAGYRNVYLPQALSQWRIYTGSTSFSRRMALSRLVYARKLVDNHPDDTFRNVSYAREAIVPRFLDNATTSMQQALRAGDIAAADACAGDIEILEGFLCKIDQQRLDRSRFLTTVIIPLLHGARNIETALHSVLQQTQSADEIIVVDVGADEQGRAIVAGVSDNPVIRLLTKPNGDRLSALNHAIRHAHGDLIAILDQDDVWYPSHLSSLAAPFHEQRARPLGWTYSDLDEINANDELTTQSVLHRADGRHTRAGLVDYLGRDMVIVPSAAVIARRSIQAVGGFDEDLSDDADEDLFIRLLQAGYDNVFIETALCRWRSPWCRHADASGPTQSRMRYARKLLDAFPDEPASGRWYSSQLIAPRFLRHAVAAARQALRAGCQDAIGSCLDDVAFLQQRVAVPPTPDATRHDLFVTAIIPLYNGATFIREALQSIFDQILPPDEVIVVDDGSTDTGADIVADMARTRPIRLISKSNGGQSSARNLGVDHAHGDLIAFLDQDDTWYPNHLSELIKPFRHVQPIPLGWTYSDLDEMNRNGELVTRCMLSVIKVLHPKRDLVSCLRHDMFILPSASLISRKAFQSVGGFDERLSGYEDDDLFLRLFQSGFDNIYLPLPLSRWRMHRSSSSYSPRMAASRATYARILIGRFPNDADGARYYVRDLIAPRFYGLMATEFRKATLNGTRVEQTRALANLAFISGHLRPARRLPLQLGLLPLLRVPPLARWIMHNRISLAAILRRLF